MAVSRYGVIIRRLLAYRERIQLGVHDFTPGIPGDKRPGITFTNFAPDRADVTGRVIASNIPLNNTAAPTAGTETQVLAVKAGAGPWVAASGTVFVGAGSHAILDSVTIGGANARRFIWAEALVSP